MDQFSHVIGVVFPVLTVIVGGFCILLYGNQTTLRATNGDQEKRIDFLEGEQERDKGTINGQAAEIDALRKVVTGEVQLTAILDLLEAHHGQTVTFQDGTTTTLSDLKAIVTRLEGRAP